MPRDEGSRGEQHSVLLLRDGLFRRQQHAAARDLAHGHVYEPLRLDKVHVRADPARHGKGRARLVGRPAALL